MNRLFVLGGGGMLGHKALQVFNGRCDIAGTFRNVPAFFTESDLCRGVRFCTGVDAWEFVSVRKVMRKFRPDVVLNCIGVIKQLDEAKRPKPAIYINSLLLHLLHEAAEEVGARSVHVSTDCVFDGRKGDYTEADPPTAEDLYGRSKYLGEVAAENALTLRTSIMGYELGSAVSLVDWSLAQEGRTVQGYTKAICTGFPTVVFCEELGRIFDRFPGLRGLHQVSADKISKYDLLGKIKQAYGVNVAITPSDTVAVDRSVDSSVYRAATELRPSSWGDMVTAMHRDYLNTYQRKH